MLTSLVPSRSHTLALSSAATAAPRPIASGSALSGVWTAPLAPSVLARLHRTAKRSTDLRCVDRPEQDPLPKNNKRCEVRCLRPRGATPRPIGSPLPRPPGFRLQGFRLPQHFPRYIRYIRPQKNIHDYLHFFERLRKLQPPSSPLLVRLLDLVACDGLLDLPPDRTFSQSRRPPRCSLSVVHHHLVNAMDFNRKYGKGVFPLVGVYSVYFEQFFRFTPRE